MALKETTKFLLASQFNRIIELTKEHDESFIGKRHIFGKWSIRENVEHLGRYQEIFSDRIRRVLVEKKPVFGRYKAEDDAEFQAWKGMDFGRLTEKIKSDRQKLFEEIYELNSNDLQRSGKHPKLGLLNIEDWCDFFLLHESHHIYTIFWLIHQFKLGND